MSINFQRIYLPTYILDFINNNKDIPSIDPQLILSTATNTQILEIILAFYPHFEFDNAAKEDQEVAQGPGVEEYWNYLLYGHYEWVDADR